MTQPDATQLHQFLVAHFSLEELKTLCFNLGVEYEDLAGEGLSLIHISEPTRPY